MVPITSNIIEDVADDIHEAVASLAQTHRRLREEIGRVIVGQDDVMDQVLTAFFARGHCVLKGVPGLAKTLIVSSLAKTMSLAFKRIQFTPDLMPSDITGAMILSGNEQSHREFVFRKGPIFTNIMLADEINRTPPKTQAALLEAMEELHVSVAGATRPLPTPFLVLATQNPIEQEGTYPLPMSQLDRFLFMIKIDYPSLADEEKILQVTTRDTMPELETLITSKAIMGYQELVRRVPVSSYVAKYAASLARATRPDNPDAPAFIRKWVQWGCGPRAGQALLLAAKSHVLLNGRFNVSIDDIRAFVHPVFRHRFGLNFTAVSEGYDTDAIIDWLLDADIGLEGTRKTGRFNFKRARYGHA
jgi:MoxR-like ATPase